MPYIITTNRTEPTDGGEGLYLIPVSRQAVATLEEAQRATAQVIANVHGRAEGLPEPISMTPAERGLADDAIGEQGGHYSLPDGTVIEVERVEYADLRRSLGDGPHWLAPDADSIDAYNERGTQTA